MPAIVEGAVRSIIIAASGTFGPHALLIQSVVELATIPVSRLLLLLAPFLTVFIVLLWARRVKTSQLCPSCCCPTKAPARDVEAQSQDSRTTQDSRTAQQNGTLWWLSALASGTLCIFVLQLTLGLATRSLTLLADLGHTGGDVVSYLVAYVAERKKQDIARRNLYHSVILDAAAALVGLVTVVGTAVSAMIQAVERLRVADEKAAEAKGEKAETDLRLLGPVLVAFAVVAAAINAALLLAHHWRTETVRRAQPSEASAVPPPPPAPAEFERREKSRGGAHNRGGAAKLLHMMVHPGCGAGTCNHPDGAQNAAGESGGKETSLNVYGAYLHVASDVLRSAVILGAGVLVEFGVLPSSTRTDAWCAIVVGVCVVTGGLALFAVACPQVWKALNARDD